MSFSWNWTWRNYVTELQVCMEFMKFYLSTVQQLSIDKSLTGHDSFKSQLITSAKIIATIVKSQQWCLITCNQCHITTQHHVCFEQIFPKLWRIYQRLCFPYQCKNYRDALKCLNTDKSKLNIFKFVVMFSNNLVT